MMAGKPVTTVLVGCGAVARLYYSAALRALEEARELKLIGLVDPNSDNVHQLRRDFPEAARFDSLFEVGSSEAQLAIVASPPRCHAEQTLQLLRAGLSVLCEKPMATSVTEGQRMVEAASNAHGLLAIGLSRRFFPATQIIRDVLSNSMIGDVVSFRFEEGSDFSWPVMSGDYFLGHEGRGGVLLDLGVHALDLLIWWWGQPGQITYEDDAMGGIEANCRIGVRFASGLSGEIRLSRDWPLANQYIITGTKGWLRWQVNEADKIHVGVNRSRYALDAQLQDSVNQLPEAVPAADFHQSFSDQLRHVVAAIRSGGQPRISAAEGLQSLILLERCYRNRKMIDMPWLTATEHKRAKELGAA